MNIERKAGPGRPHGSRNKISARIREMIADFIEENFDRVREDFDSLSPKDRVKAFTEMLPYVVSRLATTDSTIDFGRLSESDLDDIINKLIAHESEN